MPEQRAEIWVCAQCRSVNQTKAKQCYRCRTPKSLAEIDPSAIPVLRTDALPEVARPPFHSTRALAFLASALILTVAALEIVSLAILSPAIQRLADGTPFDDATIRTATNLNILSIAIPLAALVAWALWLSRVVTVMPALGLGYPASSGTWAFIENFIPIFNLFRVPAIVRDITRRLAPAGSRGDALIAAAWIGLIGGFLIPRVGGFLLGLGADSVQDVLRGGLVLAAFSAVAVLLGVIFLVAVIWWVEARIREHRGNETPSAGRTSPPVVAAAMATDAAPAAAAAAVPAAAPGPVYRPVGRSPVIPVLTPVAEVGPPAAAIGDATVASDDPVEVIDQP